MLNLPLSQRLSYHAKSPWLQHTWDSSSLGTYLRCPRRYFYQNICGLAPLSTSVDLFFGTLVHKGMEVYHITKLSHTHQHAQAMAIREILEHSWKENKGKHWRSHSNNKNLWNALRAIIYHTETFHLEPDSRTAVIGESLLAIELPFQFDLEVEVNGKTTPVTYCGHMDRVIDSGSGRWVVDYKTTTKTLNAGYFDGYQPSTQLPGYAVAAKIVFHEPVQGVIIDAFQIGVDFVRCGRGHILLGEEKADEWLHNASSWIGSAMSIGERLLGQADDTTTLSEIIDKLSPAYPMNTESCFICPFKVVCASTPSVRKHLLENSYQLHLWDPLARQVEHSA